MQGERLDTQCKTSHLSHFHRVKVEGLPFPAKSLHFTADLRCDFLIICSQDLRAGTGY